MLGDGKPQRNVAGERIAFIHPHDFLGALVELEEHIGSTEAQRRMKNDYLGIAVIGAGRIGTLRARLAAKHPAVRYVAISDADPARAKALAEQAGADVHSGDNDDDHCACRK